MLFCTRLQGVDQEASIFVVKISICSTQLAGKLLATYLAFGNKLLGCKVEWKLCGA